VTATANNIDIVTINRPTTASSFGIRVGKAQQAVTPTATEHYNNNNQPAAMATATSRSMSIEMA